MLGIVIKVLITLSVVFAIMLYLLVLGANKYNSEEEN